MTEWAASNERFHASGGVCPQTVLCGFGSSSPARTFVKPPPAWSRHHVVCNAGQRSTIGKRKTEKPRAKSGGKILK